jgi:hypothetical protein
LPQKKHMPALGRRSSYLRCHALFRPLHLVV